MTIEMIFALILLENCERLIAFIAKHLPEKFSIVDGQRINIRDHLFREIIGNLLVHREFTNAFPAKLIIEKDQVISENWNKPHATGIIDPTNFSPFPENPTIAKFFKEIGWVDELGSGVINTYPYAELYNLGAAPDFMEDDIFKVIIPLKKQGITETVEETLRLLRMDPKITVRRLTGHINLSRRGIEYHIANL